jgi:hypothetical protein
MDPAGGAFETALGLTGHLSSKVLFRQRRPLIGRIGFVSNKGNFPFVSFAAQSRRDRKAALTGTDDYRPGQQYLREEGSCLIRVPESSSGLPAHRAASTQGLTVLKIKFINRLSGFLKGSRICPVVEESEDGDEPSNPVG